MDTKQRALFVYLTGSRIGVPAKAKKILEQFHARGVPTLPLVFGTSERRASRVAELVRLYWAFFTARRRFAPTVIFIRYAYLFLPLFVYAWLRREKIQIEINTRQDQEYLKKRRYLKYLIDLIVFRLALAVSCRVHAVSPELAEYVKRRRPQAHVVFNPNFVVDDGYPPPADKPPTGRINVVFMGNTDQLWHGVVPFVERLLAANPFFASQGHFHVVGHCSEAVRAAVERTGLSHLFTAHGFLSGEAKHRTIAAMDVGVSGFDLGAAGLETTTGIKIGEYLFAGLPVALGYRDPVVPPDVPFATFLDMKMGNEALQKQFNAFLTAVRAAPGVRHQAREFAARNMSVAQYVERILSP